MPKSTKTKKTEPLKLKDYFNQLNEQNKILVRDRYLHEFETKKNTFYRVLRQERKLKQKEKHFFAIQLKKEISVLFPAQKGGNDGN
jgi:hypothetical protein